MRSGAGSKTALRACVRAVLIGCLLAGATARAEQAAPADKPTRAVPDTEALVKQANAPISSILQVRLTDTYQPEFADTDDDGNLFSISVTMPLPKYRLLPFSQLSLLTIPAAITPPDGSTGFGDLRFVDVATFNLGRNLLAGIGPTLVFPTANERRTGQEKWQAGPALVMGYAPARWLIGFLAQNPISFAGDDDRADVNVLLVQPVITYQVGSGWFVRSVPQMVFNWETDNEFVPLDLGVGRVFRIGRQRVSFFVEPFWRAFGDEPAPEYGISFGVVLLYPNFWGS